MLNSSFRYKRLAGGHIRFWRRYSVGSGSASGGISSHDGSKNDTDSDYITEPSIISAISSSFNRRKVVAILYSRDSNCKAYNYQKVAGDNFWINISALPRMQQCSINIVSLSSR